MALFTTKRIQDVLPAIGTDGAEGNPRINNRAELVYTDVYQQWVQDGRVFQANNAAFETGTLGETTFASGGTDSFLHVGVPVGTSIIPLELTLTQEGTVANDAFDIYFAYENAALFSSAGTSASVNNMRTDDPNTTACTNIETLVTVTAPTDDRGLFSGIFTQNVDDPKHSDDSWYWSARESIAPILVGPATLLVYVWVAGGAAPTVFFKLAWAEFNTNQVT